MAKEKSAEPKSKTVKMSLTVPAMLHFRLTTLAVRQGRDRSDFASEILDAGLARYTFDKQLRALAPPEAREHDPAA